MINTLAIILKKGDITEEKVDVIVNAANSGLLGGGGVDGAIHRVGGPSIIEECRSIRKDIGRCNAGDAVITTAGDLQAQYVVHAVGPIWRGGDHNEEELLRSVYERSLHLADNVMVETIAFPSISTGAYRFPIERAAPIALRVVKEYTAMYIREVRFILFSERDLETYKRINNAL